MIFDVPFFEDKREASCQGLACVKMILKYFYPKKGINENEILEKMNYKIGHWLYSTHISMGLDKFGLKVKYFFPDNIPRVSKDINNIKILTGKEASEISFEKEFDVDSYEESVDYVEKNSLFEKRNINIEELRRFLKKGCLVIVVVDRNLLKKTNDKYKGHFTLLIGFDKDGFVLNDPFIGKGLHIKYEAFERIFNSPGNFKDVIVICGKKYDI